MNKLICKTLILLLSLFSFQTSFGQDRVITGKVSDDKGAPLAGATVSAPGAKASVLVNSTGDFSITVPASAKTITISYIGMKTQSFALGNRSSLQVSLERDDSRLM